MRARAEQSESGGATTGKPATGVLSFVAGSQGGGRWGFVARRSHDL